MEPGECGRTNLNYTGSSTRVHSRGLQRASNGIIPWPVGVTVLVFVMLDIYFVSVKYVFVTVKLVCVCVKLLKI
jgi:hypothetical protein